MPSPRSRTVSPSNPAHDVSEAPKPLSASGAHPGDGRRNQLQAEQIGQEFREPILRQKVIVQQIDHKGTDARAILNWRWMPTTTTFGSGTSKTCRDWYPLPISGVILRAQFVQPSG